MICIVPFVLLKFRGDIDGCFILLLTLLRKLICCFIFLRTLVEC